MQRWRSPPAHPGRKPGDASLASRTLERYAKWRSHVFVPGARGKDSPRVEGTKEEVTFTIDLVKVGGALKTRVRAPVVEGARREARHRRSAEPSAARSARAPTTRWR